MKALAADVDALRKVQHKYMTVAQAAHYTGQDKSRARAALSYLVMRGEATRSGNGMCKVDMRLPLLKYIAGSER